ncbi:MAG TPA: FAD/NAD(P)-binding protein, partial [Solirubrobacteraceae bacterium]|nr:FAD/NAD(P)-binding protein [Solirubrobacteraceae bacterium]
MSGTIAARPVRLAIVGGGPSCTYVLERLAATAPLLPPGERLRIDVFERSGRFGDGAVHSAEQPRTSFLNRIVGQVAFAADESVEAAGPLLDRALRPTLHEWCRTRFAQTGDPVFDVAPEDWPMRYVHGLALVDSFRRYVELLRATPGVELELHTAEVVDVAEDDDELRLHVAGRDEPVTADHVLLVTGHSSNDPHKDPRVSVHVDFAERHGTGFVASAYPLERHLGEDAVGPGDTVSCLGMGLTAIDVLLFLTEGRGGRFERAPDGELRYVRAGREPRAIVPCSEAGLFTYARPYNAKERDLARFEHRGVFLTTEAIDRLRASVGVPVDLGREGTRRQLDFERHVLPLVLLEMSWLHHRTLLGDTFGDHLRSLMARPYAEFLDGAHIADRPDELLTEIERAVDAAQALIDGVLAGTRGRADAAAEADRAGWSFDAAF